jgi:hypothetical protein
MEDWSTPGHLAGRSEVLHFAGFDAEIRPPIHPAGRPTSQHEPHASDSCAHVSTDAAERRDHGNQVTDKPFVRLNVLDVQKLAALRYHTW